MQKLSRSLPRERVEPDATAAAQPARRDAKVLAWDLPTRLFKWCLAGSVVVAWATNAYAQDRPYLHKWNGYAVLILIVFRILWGFVGGSTARFSAFMTWPWTATRFLFDQLRGRGGSYLGHSPVAGWMVVALMALLFSQATLGLFSADQDRLFIEGPMTARVSDAFVQRVSSLHRTGFTVILVLAGIHILANLLYAAFGQRDYIKAMVTGTKARAPYVDLSEARPGSLGAALACAVAAAAIVLGTIAGFGTHPFQ